jgi:translocation protein SEC63
VQKDAQKPSFLVRMRSYMNKFNITLAVLWLIIIALGCYISTIKIEVEPFNPFTILNIPETATEKEIKKAYRDLSRIWHPDKQKDNPEASEKFVNIHKAHQALTDEVAKENWIKYGHPDGEQVRSGPPRSPI